MCKFSRSKITSGTRTSCEINIVVYDIVYDLKYNLPGGSFSETMFGQIKRVAPGLGPSIEKLALPLTSSKGAEATLCARNNVVL